MHQEQLTNALTWNIAFFIGKYFITMLVMERAIAFLKNLFGVAVED